MPMSSTAGRLRTSRKLNQWTLLALLAPPRELVEADGRNRAQQADARRRPGRRRASAARWWSSPPRRCRSGIDQAGEERCRRAWSRKSSRPCRSDKRRSSSLILRTGIFRSAAGRRAAIVLVAMTPPQKVPSGATGAGRLRSVYTQCRRVGQSLMRVRVIVWSGEYCGMALRGRAAASARALGRQAESGRNSSAVNRRASAEQRLDDEAVA